VIDHATQNERETCAALVRDLLAKGFSASMTERPGWVTMSAEWPGGRGWRGQGANHCAALTDFAENAKGAACGW